MSFARCRTGAPSAASSISACTSTRATCRNGAKTSRVGSRQATSCSRTGITTSHSAAGTVIPSAICSGRRRTEATDMAVIVERDDFASLVDPGAELTLLASGYVFTEGPVWNVKEQALYYSDIPG